MTTDQQRWKWKNNAGTNHPKAKLKDEQVYLIRQWYDAGESGKERAKEIGISPNRYSLIGRRLAWTHLPEKDQST